MRNNSRGKQGARGGAGGPGKKRTGRAARGGHDPRAKRDPRDTRGQPDPRDARGKRDPRDARGKPDPRDARGKRDPHDPRGKRDTREARAKREARGGGAHAPQPARHEHGRGGGSGYDPRRAREVRHGDGLREPHLEAERAAAAARVSNSAELLAQRAPLRQGEWLWTMREGAERDLIEELLLADGELAPRGAGPALVISRAAPGARDARLDVTFARQGFRVLVDAHAADTQALAARIAQALASSIGGEAYALHVFVPDSAQGNPLAGRAQSLESALEVQLTAAVPNAKRVGDVEMRRESGSLPLLQVCMYGPDAAAAGMIPTDRALSLSPGGRARMRLSGEQPSRAARKLEEAFAWLGMSPGAGELCVDLGAAPGGWSWLLLQRRARVIAVDPARMDEKLMQDRRLRHVQGDAFKFAPDETADWLFCDMVWRPMEVAQMLGRWARQRYTRMLVSNFKLPMKRKAETVRELRRTLEAAGYTGLRTRQLYHDREEITLTARVR